MSKSMNFKLRQQRGFMLIEVCLAIFILMIVLYSVLPTWMLLQEKMDASQQKAVSLLAAQNEIEKFNHYVEIRANSEIEQNGYTYQVSWQVNERGELEEGRLYIAWFSTSKKNENLEYQLWRIRKRNAP